MEKLFLIAMAVVNASTATSCAGMAWEHDITDRIPLIDTADMLGYQRIPDVAQYKEADWSNVIGLAAGISLSAAKGIADAHPEISYFFYVKAASMMLEKIDGSYRYFSHGDAVFFSGAPWWGSANGYSDGYIKRVPGG